jgi:hypothetical protein
MLPLVVVLATAMPLRRTAHAHPNYSTSDRVPRRDSKPALLKVGNCPAIPHSGRVLREIGFVGGPKKVPRTG